MGRYTKSRCDGLPLASSLTKHVALTKLWNTGGSLVLFIIIENWNFCR